MLAIELTRWLHVLGACVLIGTGSGIAFFMLIAHRTGDVAYIARTASTVVLADKLFTATAAILQPITGWGLAYHLGWPLTEGWIMLSLLLYAAIGAFWLPVLWIQAKMRDLAWAAMRKGEDLPPRYHRLFRIWFACGVPAFLAIGAILWLMINRPVIWG